MDCSRTSLRHGAENVAIVYRRTRSELVVDEEELGETEREGVRMEFLASPIEVLGERRPAHSSAQSWTRPGAVVPVPGRSSISGHHPGRVAGQT
jgi:NADPH-dependent glutamate synthase beta subunit-like oxidoreductase